MFSPESQKRIREHHRQAIKGVVCYEATIRSKIGKDIPVFLSSAPFSKGLLITLTDLRNVKALEKTEAEFQTLAKYSVDAMVSLDEHNKVRAWNRGAQAMFGWTQEEILGQSILRIVPQDRIAAGEPNFLRKEVETKGFVRNHETVGVHKNGTPLKVALTYSSILDDKNRLVGYCAVYRDITLQKRWEQDLQDRFERMQEAYMEMGKLRRYVDYIIDLLDMGAGSFEGANPAYFIVNAILMFARADAVVLRWYDEKKNRLNLLATAGTTDDWESKGHVPFDGSLAEKSFLLKKPLKILDVTQDISYCAPGLARKNNLRSLLLLPLMINGTGIGTISVYVASDNRLEVLDHEFLPIFAKQAAFVLALIRQSRSS